MSRGLDEFRIGWLDRLTATACRYRLQWVHYFSKGRVTHKTGYRVLLKRFLYAVPIVTVVVLAVLAVSFWLVPTGRLNAVIAKQLTEAFGHTVVVTGRASVSLLPYLSVGFGPIKVMAGDGQGKTIMEIERASGRLSVTSLWEGQPALRFITLERARMTMVRHENGSSNWSATRFFVPNSTQAEEIPKLRFPRRLRRVLLKDSTLSIEDPSFEQPEILTAINAEIVGPPRSQDFSIDGSFIWRGELITTKTRLTTPGVFLTGGESRAVIEFASAPLTASFKGDLSWQDFLRGEGLLDVTTQSGAALATWLGYRGGAVLPDGKLSILGDGIFSRKKLSFRPIAVKVGEGKADGRLEIDLSGPGLGLSGTLAFDRLVIDEEEGKSGQSPFEKMIVMGQAGAFLDLRLSVGSLRIGAQEMRNLAVGVVLKDPSFVLNVGTVELLDREEENGIAGYLSGKISSDFKGQQHQLGANLTLDQASFTGLGRFFSLKIPLDGKFSASLQASAQGADATTLEQTLSTALDIKIETGRLNRVSIDGVGHNDDEVKDGKINGETLTTAFTRGRVTGTINPEGVFDVDALSFITRRHKVKAMGVISLTDDRISLAGFLVNRLGKVNAGEELNYDRVPFTFGGLLSAPRISSVANHKVIPDDKTQ